MNLTRVEWRQDLLEQMNFLKVAAQKTLTINVKDIELQEMLYFIDLNSMLNQCERRIEIFLKTPYSETFSKIYDAFALDAFLLGIGASMNNIAEITKAFEDKEYAVLLSEVLDKLSKIAYIYIKIAIAEFKAFKRWLKRNASFEIYNLFSSRELDEWLY
jgi:hypothetical protein